MQQGFYGWFLENLRGKKGQQGFTLIELLVVVTILGILAAIVTLSLVGLTTNATNQACNQEYRTVQSGMDAFMAANNLSTVNTPNANTNDMAFVLGQDSQGNNLSLYQLNLSPSNPTNYVRNQHTLYYYTWNSAGKIINPIQTSSGGTAPCAAQ